MRTLLTSLFAMSLCGCETELPSANGALPQIEYLTENGNFPIKMPTAFESQHGYLSVAESRGRSSTKSIRLPFVVIKAKDPKPALAPVLLLMGGPGVGSLSAASYPGAYPWTEQRDFVIFGQRGTEFAEPALMCSGVGEKLVGPDSQDSPQVLAAVSACAEEMKASEVDLSAYNSANSARDIEDLRLALGFDQWSLFGLSYGTRLALTYARDFPSRVQSMVLDSPLPHDAVFDDESAANLEQTIRRIAADCADQPTCAKAFPDLANRFFSEIEKTKSSAWTVDGVVVSAADLIGLIPLGSANQVRIAPVVMHAIAERDISTLKPYLNGAGVAVDFAWGMRLAIWCSESAPFSIRAANQTAPDAFAGIDSAVFHPAMCDAFDVPKRPVAEKAVTSGHIPTLVVAGEYDAMTPPLWAERAAAPLHKARVLVMPQSFHTETVNWGGDGCAMSHAAAFFADPERYLQGIQPDCLAQRDAIYFETDFTGE